MPNHPRCETCDGPVTPRTSVVESFGAPASRVDDAYWCAKCKRQWYAST